MLQIENLTKCYDSLPVLEQASLIINTGTIHGLVGKNGAGKTTLLQTIMGIYKADNGTIKWHSESIYENPSVKQKLYIIPDFLQFSAFETVRTLARQHRVLYPKWSESRYLNLLNGFNIDESKHMARLSKGEQRQVMFSLALATQPELLLLDEPFDGLDPIARHQVKSLLFQDVAEGSLTVLVSSHDMVTLEDLCDAITFIYKGKIKLNSELDTLKESMHKVQIGFTSQPPLEFNQLTTLHREQRGNLHLLIMSGCAIKIHEQLKQLNPNYLELQPLSLDERFIYEMEGFNDAFKNIQL